MLSVGALLGPYEVVSSLGAGGMGEVYRARDTKLDREVALKVLPEAFTWDPDRLARFVREAKVLASLNHPNIGHIYGLEEADGQKALVLELVEGPTLADRITRGPIPLDEALPIAKQIAEALEAAHEQGIIHRDLKPANVKVRPDGTVKVLDFGLARVADFDGGSQGESVSRSPTLTRDTAPGAVLGTAAYMSPEQARGRTLDKRSDIWSFGICLFEALTGQRPFSGETTTDVLAAIVQQEPAWHLLDDATPWRVREILRQCLQKDVRERLRDIGDARIGLQSALAGPEMEPQTTPAPRRHARWWVTLAVAPAAALVAWFVRPHLSSPPSEPRRSVTRFTIDRFSTATSPPAISPDGRLIAISTREGLELRAMDSLERRLIPHTVGAWRPFFSPDSRWVGYSSSGVLYKVRVDAGAPPTRVSSGVPLVSGASWGSAGTIVVGLKMSGLTRVAADGSGSTVLTQHRPEQGELGHSLPHVLPDGENVLFTIETNDQPRVAVASLESGHYRTLFAGSNPRYIAPGHILFVQAGTMFAQPFDLDELRPSGDPYPVLQGILGIRWGTVSTYHYSVSDGGTLIHVPGGDLRVAYDARLVEVDRRGRVRRLTEADNEYLYPRLSPDGTQLVVSQQHEHRDLWLLDLERDTRTRFTFDGTQYMSVWAPKGDALAYLSDEGLAWQRVDGTGSEEILFAGWQAPGGWSPDGTLLAVTRMRPETKGDIWIVPRDGGAPTPFLDSAFDERAPVFSPDGRYLLYVSDESGVEEVYVRPFPGPGPREPVSTGGGTEPLWSAESNEIFYRHGEEVHVVPVLRLLPAIELGDRKLLFKDGFDRSRIGPPNYDVSRDGETFIMVQPEEQSEFPAAPIHVVLNWFEELREARPDAE